MPPTDADYEELDNLLADYWLTFNRANRSMERANVKRSKLIAAMTAAAVTEAILPQNGGKLKLTPDGELLVEAPVRRV